MNIWRNTILTAAVYGTATAILERLLRVRMHLAAGMSLAVAFAAVQFAAIILMLAALVARWQVNAFRAARSRRLVPQIHDALAAHAIGFDQTSRLEQFRRLEPHEVRQALFAVLQSARGEARDRVASLVPELGVLERRSQQDPVERIRDLSRLGPVERFEQIVTEVARQNRFVRAIAAEELRPHAADIAQSQIRHALQASEARVAVAALEMLRSWRRAQHIDGFLPLLDDPDAEIRAEAFLALPYAAAGVSPETIVPAIVRALRHADPAVRAAAASAAGRMGIAGAADALGERLADRESSVVVAAAFALAALGESGQVILGGEVSAGRPGAAAAVEALEKAALGRLAVA